MTSLENILEEIIKREHETISLLEEKKKELECILGISNEDEFKKLGKSLPKDKEQATEEKRWLDPQKEYNNILDEINEIKTKEKQIKYN